MNRSFTRYQKLPDVDDLIVSANLTVIGVRKESRPNAEQRRSLPEGLEPLGKWRKGFDKVEGPQGPSVREARESLGQREGKPVPKPARQDKCFRA